MRRLGGVIVGSVGLGGVVFLGGVFGGRPRSPHTAASRASVRVARNCINPRAYTDNRNVTTYGTVSTVGFIAGGVLLAGGITLYLTARPVTRAGGAASHVEVQLAPRGLGLTGSFWGPS